MCLKLMEQQIGSFWHQALIRRESKLCIGSL